MFKHWYNISSGSLENKQSRDNVLIGTTTLAVEGGPMIAKSPRDSGFGRGSDIWTKQRQYIRLRRRSWSKGRVGGVLIPYRGRTFRRRAVYSRACPTLCPIHSKDLMGSRPWYTGNIRMEAMSQEYNSTSSIAKLKLSRLAGDYLSECEITSVDR